MKKVVLFSVIVVLLGGLTLINFRHGGEGPTPLATGAEPTFLEIELTHMADDGTLPAQQIVTIEYDHFFKTAKQYHAVSLRQLLDPYMQQLGVDANSDAVVTFYCTDGYKPMQKLKELLAGEGYLALRDEAEAAQAWPDSVREKMAPFYLVWKNLPYEDDSLTWPYGLYKIKIDKFDDTYNPIRPKDNAKAMAGFEHFEHYCIKCHPINRIGGNVGPDMNYPKNITDYWEVENIWAYAKDPQSFRYNARMAPVTPLTRAEFDQIIAYLRYIRQVKPEAG